MSPYPVLLLHGGVFRAFSDVIMRSLSLTGGRGGVEAMQVIDREVFRWAFMALFLGLAPVSLAVIGLGVAHGSGGAGAPIALSGTVYLVGRLGVTVFCNLPMTQALAKTARRQGARADWTATHLPRWTFWTTARTLAGIVSAALLMAGLARPIPRPDKHDASALLQPAPLACYVINETTWVADHR